MKLLLVDNSALIRKQLGERLAEIKQVQVSYAASVGQALEALREHNPEVVILDLHLPDGSGFDVLAQIRKNSFHTVVVVVSEPATSYHRHKSVEAGADFFFDKWNSLKNIYDLVQWLARRKGEELLLKRSSTPNNLTSTGK